MLKVEENNQAIRGQVKSRGVENLRELKYWVSQVIDEAERTGDARRKTKFLALQAELSV